MTHTLKPDGRGQGMRVCADCGQTEPKDDSACPAAPLPVVDAQCKWTHRGSDRPCSDKGSYRMQGSCGNCKSEIVGVFTLGHEARSGWNSPDCPVCGCDNHLYWKKLAGSAPQEEP